MCRTSAAVLLLTFVPACLTAAARGDEATTRPAAEPTATQPPTAPANATQPQIRRRWGSPRGQTLTAEQVYDLNAEPRFWSKWACILAGLALLGVIWSGWSMRTLAKNQIELGRMIEALGTRQSE